MKTLEIPFFRSSFLRICPDFPMNGRPSLSSSAPGASPTTMTSASSGPSPATQTVLAVLYSSQLRHFGFRLGISSELPVSQLTQVNQSGLYPDTLHCRLPYELPH